MGYLDPYHFHLKENATQRAKAGNGTPFPMTDFEDIKSSKAEKVEIEKMMRRKYSTPLTFIIEDESIPDPSIDTPAVRHIAFNSKHRPSPSWTSS